MLTPELTRIRQLETENNRLKFENLQLNEKLDKARGCVVELLESLRPHCSYSFRMQLDKEIAKLK